METGQGQNFWDRLRSTSNRNKQLITFFGTFFIMVVIITVWLKFFNNFNSPASEENQSSFTFWETFKNGFVIIKNIIWEKIKDLAALLNNPRESIINPPQ